MTNDVKSYFFEKYKNSHIRVVPGHWPDLKSREEVDDCFLLLESMFEEAESEKAGGNRIEGIFSENKGRKHHSP